MPLYLIALFAIAAAILLSATTILNSRALTEKLVGRQIISRFIADLFPAMASACRVLGVFFILIGFCWAGMNSGFISPVWVEHFGAPALVVGVGIFMLVRFRKIT